MTTTSTTPAATTATSTTAAEVALFDRARDWLHAQGEPRWIAEAFGHWVITEIVPHGPVPEPLHGLWRAWTYDPVPARYRARHGARFSDAGPWCPGQPLPEPVRHP